MVEKGDCIPVNNEFCKEYNVKMSKVLRKHHYMSFTFPLCALFIIFPYRGLDHAVGINVFGI